MSRKQQCWKCSKLVKLGILDDAGREWCYPCASVALAASDDAEKWRQRMLKERAIADGDVDAAIAEVGKAHAALDSAKCVSCGEGKPETCRDCLDQVRGEYECP